MRNRIILEQVTLWLGLALMLAALFLIFAYVPTEATMGTVQRIFYFHVPLAWLTFLAFFIIFFSSVLYLWKRQRKWDILALSSAQIGFIFATLVLITGAIWAKPAWGVWWTWDARLTTALVMWLMYIAYLTVRSLAPDPERGARFAAVIGIVGFVDVPIVAMAIVLWRTQHPTPIIFEGGLEGSMLLTLLVSLAAFTVLFVHLLSQRTWLEEAQNLIERLKANEE